MINRHFLAATALVTALCGASAAAQAQAAPALSPASAPSAAPFAHKHHRSRLARALRSLDLSSAERAQIRTILGNARQAKQSGTPLPHRQVLSQIEGVLTPAQRTAFEAALAHPVRIHPQPAATP